MPTPTDLEPELDTRLELYRQQVRLRLFERRADDLFTENLVKGTSHHSLGQEAIAAGAACSAKLRSSGPMAVCFILEAYANVAER